MVRSSEVEYFFRVVSILRLAQVAGCTDEQLAPWYDEVASLEFTTENPKIHARCVDILSERYADPTRYTTEPFYGDLSLA